jgi:YD repeat-containing protein
LTARPASARDVHYALGMTRLLAGLALLGWLFAQMASAGAQPPSIHYVYDALNRLSAVVDQHGLAATYTYDAVGNILRIDRFEPPAGAVAISLFTPGAGITGTTVHVFGRGFHHASLANVVAFNGTAAPVASAAANRLTVTVPPGATTGPITVTTPLGTATSAAKFRVLGRLAITPSGLTIPVGATREFTATEDGVPTTRVQWLVDGIPGGEASTGTIASNGSYTAPSSLPFPPVVTVAATHRDDSSAIASAPVTITPPQPLFVASRDITVAVRPPALAVDANVTASLSIAVIAGGVATFGAAAPVSVRLAAIPEAFAAGHPVSVSLAPVVTAVAPVGAAAGSTGIEVTLMGSGFAGATAVSFHRNGVRDADITASHVSVNSDGTEAVVEITVAPHAPAGVRVVRVSTGVGVSTGVATDGNVFSIP